MKEDRYVPSSEASKIIGYKEQTLANWRFRGVGPCYTKRGNSIRYRVSDLLTFMESKRVDPGDSQERAVKAKAPGGRPGAASG
jgi:hypothetical protein